MDREFWEILDEMLNECEIVIDRPAGSRHPKHESIVYPLDYGYLRGTRSMDGSGIDIWLGSQTERKIDAVICTADSLKKDSEIKLLIGCTVQETEIICRFHNESPFMKGMLIRRNA